ncbi:integrin alpha-E [Chroicocephalus ridibundus]|uniref:integrin alpha-E n=1 Tax=Chroicocephalus ridibundus TaxID=1192867 RepID=UPI002FDEFC2D
MRILQLDTPPLEDQLSDSSSLAAFTSLMLIKTRSRALFLKVKPSEISSGLQYFGQSIDGGFDFTSDGLQDITVGSLENGIVLRPVTLAVFPVFS